MKLRTRDGFLPLDKTSVMGVLNVTPDSFSDGGLWLDRDAAVGHGLEMARLGAAIIDVRGESTRPGAEPVAEDDELRRVIPVVEEIARRIEVPISIDTRKARVARAAIEAGAAVVNNTLGEEDDKDMDEVVLSTGTAVILMHSRGTPSTMRSLARYGNVVSEVASFLEKRASQLVTRGAPQDSIVLDPGFGFAKSPEQNLEMLNGIDDFMALGYPLLVGTSRKSFIGAVVGGKEDERLEGTEATVAWAAAHGVHIVRVHDVAENLKVVRMIEAIRSAGGADLEAHSGE